MALQAVAAAFGGDPLAARVFALFAEEDPAALSAQEFARAVAELRRLRAAPREQQSGFLFKAYDGDRDGFVSPGDLAEVLAQSWGGSAPRELARGVALRMVCAFDQDGDGKLNGREFRLLARGSDLEALLKIPVVS